MPWQKNIINEFQAIYTKQYFDVVTDWTNQSVAGFVRQNQSDLKFEIVLPAGLLRAASLNEESLRMLLCHEAGHVLGGSPRKNTPPEWDGPIAPDGASFLSSEGEADYYASLVCFKKITSGQNHQNFFGAEDLTPRLISKCKKENYLCLRSAVAAKKFLEIVRSDLAAGISFESPDLSVVSKTIRDSYPSRQCRLDTLLSGSLCSDVFPLALDFNNASNGQCHDPEGLRPSCWYAALQLSLSKLPGNYR